MLALYSPSWIPLVFFSENVQDPANIDVDILILDFDQRPNYP